MKFLVSAILVLGFSSVVMAIQNSNYSGQEKRAIKSLSQSDIDGYLAGKGMGLAKAAELNHFPGPKHVIELANELDLSKDQIEETKRIYEVMQTKAIKYGRVLVQNEEKLERLFVENTVTPLLLEQALNESADIKSKLRKVHLIAHLEQKNILSKHQIEMYDNLRGYSNTSQAQGHKHHH